MPCTLLGVSQIFWGSSLFTKWHAGCTYETKRKLMAAVMRVLLWALVLLAPGGLLLAPVLAAHELRRRSRANSSNAPQQASVPSPL
jgi:hypothetical protein